MDDIKIFAKNKLEVNGLVLTVQIFPFFLFGFSFHEHSRFTGQQGKREAISLTPLYHLHPLPRDLEIGQALAGHTTAENSPLHIANSRTRTRNL